MRNASGLTAADLAHAQGFRECSGILSNSQYVAQTQTNGFCQNVAAQNAVYTELNMQGRSTINGVGNRKRSFGNVEANQVKKAKTDGLSLPLEMLNDNGSHGSDKEVLMENMNVDSDEAAYSVAGQAVSWGGLSEDPNQPLHPKECDTTSASMDNNHFHHHVYRDTPEKMTANNTVGSQIEHQKSVKEEQIYDHMLLSTMFLYHGS